MINNKMIRILIFFKCITLDVEEIDKSVVEPKKAIMN